MSSRCFGPIRRKFKALNFIDKSFSGTGRFLLSGVPEGYDAPVLAQTLAAKPADALHLHIARDAKRMAAMAEALEFFAPEISVVSFPAWDCLPYDRVSPNREIASERIEALTYLAGAAEGRQSGRLIVLTSVNAALQRVPARTILNSSARRFAIGSRVNIDEMGEFFSRNGFERVGTVREPGEYAVRGGILDIFPPGEKNRCVSTCSATRSRRCGLSIRSRSCRSIQSKNSRSNPQAKYFSTKPPLRVSGPVTGKPSGP